MLTHYEGDGIVFYSSLNPHLLQKKKKTLEGMTHAYQKDTGLYTERLVN